MHVLGLLVSTALLTGAAPTDTVLVFDLDHSADVGDDVARTMTDLVVSEVSSRLSSRVLSGADIRALTALEGEKQALGCDDDSSCLAEIANAMGARYLISGRVSTLGPELVLQLSLFDASKAEPIARQNARAATLPALADRVPGVVSLLLVPLGVAPSPAVDDKTANGASDGEGGLSVVSLSLFGAGGVLVALALAGIVTTGGVAAVALSGMLDKTAPAPNREGDRIIFSGAGALLIVAAVVGAVGTGVLAAGFFVE